MKHLTILSLLIFITCTVTAQHKFKMYIEQNGYRIAAHKNTVKIDPGTFNIVFEFPEPMGVLVNGSRDQATYKAASRNESFEQLPGFSETGMAEGLGNKDKEIILAEYAPGFWFYDDDKTHRFNSVERKDGKLICKRTIENLYDKTSQTSVKVADTKGKLYIVAVSAKKGKTWDDKIEVHREYIIVKMVK